MAVVFEELRKELQIAVLAGGEPTQVSDSCLRVQQAAAAVAAAVVV